MCFSCGNAKNKRKRVSSYVRRKDQWNTYTISCCENWGNCCCCLWCCPFAMADLYHYICWFPWPIALVFGITLFPIAPLLSIPLRLRVRSKHNLEGNLISDLLCLLCCCWPCVICQLRDQVQSMRRKGTWRLNYGGGLADTPPWIQCWITLWRKCRRKRVPVDEEAGESKEEEDGSTDDDDGEEEEDAEVDDVNVSAGKDTGGASEWEDDEEEDEDEEEEEEEEAEEEDSESVSKDRARGDNS
ncbi:unnamed protein product [Dicrocoelium dendriticum]|nr:unnamed protein product [Dicrocoelium dendriticum]